MRVNIQGLIDNAKCYQMVRQLRWPEGVECPHCHATEVAKNGHDETQAERQRYLCRILPPFDEHGMQEEEVIEYSHKMLERMINLNMLTEGETDDCGEMTLWINEPETWA